MINEATSLFLGFLLYFLTVNYSVLEVHLTFTFNNFQHFSKFFLIQLVNNTKNACILTKSSVIKAHDKIKQFLKNDNNTTEKDLVNVKETIENKQTIRYENKYLEQIRLLPDEYILTEDDKVNKEFLFETFFTNETRELSNAIQESKTNLANLQQELSDIENMEFNDDDRKVTYDNDGNEIPSFEERIKEKKEFCSEQISKIKRDLICLNETFINEEDIRKKVMEHIINERLDNLKNSFVIEKTPLGNVLMFYNNKKKTFEYYTDNSMPYRFLEVVSRKYVLTFKCRFLYVDMEKELKDVESKLEEKEKDLQLKAEDTLLNKSGNDVEKNKKNVFAKFKSYNKQMGTGVINKVPPPSNSIPNTKNRNNFSEKILLKENANHYTCAGKFANFNILKKVDKKIINKKYSLSFADFKKSVIHKK